MQEDKNVIIVPLPDEDPFTELPSAQLKESLHATQLRIGDLAKELAKGIQIEQTVRKTLGPALKNIADIISEVNDFTITMKPMLDALQQISSHISKAVATIKIPTLSEERKQEILESNKKWGRYGWTWIKSAPVNFYNMPPLDYKDANNKVKPFCSAQAIDSLIDDLRQQNINKTDLESAIFCYRHKQYKACSLILFGLIDAKLIRKQPIGQKQRKVGFNAVKIIEAQFEEQKEEQAFFTMLCFANLITCLETFFVHANDFKNEPITVNRNFVAHGMNRRRVRKRDCIQLFLALNNLLLLRLTSDNIIL